MSTPNRGGDCLLNDVPVDNCDDETSINEINVDNVVSDNIVTTMNGRNTALNIGMPNDVYYGLNAPMLLDKPKDTAFASAAVGGDMERGMSGGNRQKRLRFALAVGTRHGARDE